MVTYVDNVAGVGVVNTTPTVADANVVQATTPPVPLKATDLRRKSLRSRTTLDRVEDVLLGGLYDDPEFQKYINAGFNAEAVEGSLRADGIVAAQMIRDAAPPGPLKSNNLETIRKALNRVLNRYYDMSRDDRRKLAIAH